jgi:hypothetical protein
MDICPEDLHQEFRLPSVADMKFKNMMRFMRVLGSLETIVIVNG